MRSLSLLLRTSTCYSLPQPRSPPLTPSPPVHIQTTQPTSRQSRQRVTGRTSQAEKSADANAAPTANRAAVRHLVDPQLETADRPAHTSSADRRRRGAGADGHHDAQRDAVDGADGAGHGRGAQEYGPGEDWGGDGEV